jgi:hypothetical protein
MSFLDRLERNLGRFAIPGLSLYLVVGQVFATLATLFGLLDPGRLVFVPALARAGQWWRVVSFLFQPPATGGGLFGLVFLVFAWWIFYFMGTALEGHWGVFRFNLFLFVGYALTVGLAFFAPGSPVANGFLVGSVFLAFAYLNPNFELLLFFILPVKIKWLAFVTWVFYVYRFIVGGWPDRLQIVAAVGNFILFFGGDAWNAAGRIQRQRAVGRPAGPAGPGGPRHRCRICGKTDKTNPELDFRYCSKCAGDPCYCPEHIYNHEHVLSENGGKTSA